MTWQLVFLFVLWLVAGFLFARAWRAAPPETQANPDGSPRYPKYWRSQVPYEQLGQKAP